MSGGVDVGIRECRQEACELRPVVKALISAINHAKDELSKHIEKYHDYEDDDPEKSNLRGIQHHLIGSLIEPAQEGRDNG